MRRFIKKLKFILITVFMVITLVASNEINYSKIAQENQILNACTINNTVACLEIYQKPILPTPFPNNPQTEQERFLSAIATNLPEIPQPNSYEYILLRAYGAAFVDPDPTVKFPSKVVFNNEQETEIFQTNLTMDKIIGTNNCYLQQSAALALNKARSQQNIPLKSGYGASDCTRNYATNLRFWRKYANKNTLDKVREGKETAILGVVAPPGASQHLWGLAIDLRVSNTKQRQALYDNGWFQTVENDIPHWTYLGVNADNLASLGLKNKVVRGISYWLTPI
ncbi:M15 family metallopeptidase [Nostoc parmelioides]|uniref:D-alanyl-D-alanine carboxypeptidase family protein n=1 Tax=Nostoc parmelioides FACHB-3921 TaxID=2692909 RepID=A0ABR8BG32_9NOSO|nr:M15 family metallopeptidase [Nostoc parmelioides]MBD2252735.1 D-alanyl-D-alanine carboxypeptidase family protein [Nostoc parmelioides FACHB-3921]